MLHAQLQRKELPAAKSPDQHEYFRILILCSKSPLEFTSFISQLSCQAIFRHLIRKTSSCSFCLQADHIDRANSFHPRSDQTTMSQFVPRNKHGEYRDIFPGTAEQAKRFQQWIKEEIPWLHPSHVLAGQQDGSLLAGRRS